MVGAVVGALGGIALFAVAVGCILLRRRRCAKLNNTEEGISPEILEPFQLPRDGSTPPTKLKADLLVSSPGSTTTAQTPSPASVSPSEGSGTTGHPALEERLRSLEQFAATFPPACASKAALSSNRLRRKRRDGYHGKLERCSAVYIYGIDIHSPANISFQLSDSFISSFHFYSGSDYVYNALFYEPRCEHVTFRDLVDGGEQYRRGVERVVRLCAGVTVDRDASATSSSGLGPPAPTKNGIGHRGRNANSECAWNGAPVSAATNVGCDHSGTATITIETELDRRPPGWRRGCDI
ncbi:hypothetical protein FB45DRAFT_871834 [Roridomyces roridus]|uniref:Uncharacterized protein n=1 Tax=Roridomyces roridus TaxID=1738132 RepID=A0AAD7BG15_9AGAR|nr:hypothetical protein FB45DRAFT_871834 [Roridomyces roridus]